MIDETAVLDTICKKMCLYSEEIQNSKRCMENKEINNRIRGSLIGGAIGDALGYPVEFLS